MEQENTSENPRPDASSVKKLNTGAKLKTVHRAKAQSDPSSSSSKKNTDFILKMIHPTTPVVIDPSKKNTGFNLKMIRPTLPRPFVAATSPKKNTGFNLKMIRPTLPRPFVAATSPKLNTGLNLKMIRPTLAQPVVAAPSPKSFRLIMQKNKRTSENPKPDTSCMKKLNTGAKLKTVHHAKAQSDASSSSSKLNIGEKIKKVHFVTELPQEKGDMKPLKLRIVRSLSDLNSSKKFKCSVKEGPAPEVLKTPEKEVTDCQASGSSTRFCTKDEGTSDSPRKSEKVLASGVQLDCSESQSRENLECGDKIKFLDDKKKPKNHLEFVPMTELPENIFDSSDDEDPNRGYARVGDGVYDSFLTSKQKKKEDRLTEAYFVGGSGHWEFSGKGSSDIDFLLWSQPRVPPLQVLDFSLNRLEESATQNFRGQSPEIQTD